MIAWVVNSVRKYAVRIAWVTLFGLHVALLVRSLCLAEASIGGQIALAVTVVFLGLKSVGLAALRFRCSRRAVVAGMLIVVVMHAGVIDRSFEADVSLLWPWMVPLAFSVWCLDSRWVRVLGRLLSAAAAALGCGAGISHLFRVAYVRGDLDFSVLRGYFVLNAWPRCPPFAA